MIFQKRAKKYIDSNFHIDNEPVEIVQNYTYLGTLISSTNNLSLALDKLKEKALHALFSLRKHTNLRKLFLFLAVSDQDERIFLRSVLTSTFVSFSFATYFSVKF